MSFIGQECLHTQGISPEFSWISPEVHDHLHGFERVKLQVV